MTDFELMGAALEEGPRSYPESVKQVSCYSLPEF